MRRFIIFAAVLVCLAAQCIALDDWVEKKAAEYRGYDELIGSITEVGYGNRTYYFVSYTKAFMPSGYLLFDSGGVVEDPALLRLFARLR